MYAREKEPEKWENPVISRAENLTKHVKKKNRKTYKNVKNEKTGVMKTQNKFFKNYDFIKNKTTN